MSQQAYIGQTVHYYSNGQRDKQTVPQPAIVNRAWDGEVCDLAIIPVQDGAVLVKDYVPRIGDPRLKNHHDQPSPLAYEVGAWDFIPQECCGGEESCDKDCPEKPAAKPARKPAAKK